MIEQDPNNLIPKNTESEEKPSTTVEQFPVVSNISPLKLIKAYADQVFFQDTAGKIWRMDFEKNSWTEASIMDFHPMATQFTKSLEIKKDNFENIEDAVMYAQKLYLQNEVEESVKFIRSVSNDPENKENQEAILFFQEYGRRGQHIVDLIEQYENAGLNERPELMQQIKKQVAELEEFNKIDDTEE